jgi:membrane protease YdiL (CAAX protease family)
MLIRPFQARITMPSVQTNLATFGRAAVIASAITAIGQTLWGALVFANLRVAVSVPWSAMFMVAILAGLMAYLNGAGWPRRTAAARHALARLNPIPRAQFIQAILAGVLAIIALGGLWLVTSDLVVLPRGLTPDVHGYPVQTVVALLAVACIAAPLSEEAAFRGYAQGMLEKAWGSAPAAIIGSSVLFAAAHVIQGFFLPKLGLYFAAGLIFGAIAYLTNSLWASMVVHAFADLMGFLLLWPHDAQPHGLVSAGGTDPAFWPALAALVLATPLALAAFQRLARMRGQSPASGATPTTASGTVLVGRRARRA